MKAGDRMNVEQFGRTAANLSRNPLGIIALFLVLVYGIAAFVVSAVGLDQDAKGHLVWFLVTFPFAVLAVFVFLVVRHHTKLYSPTDYSNPADFLRAATYQTSDQQLQRVDQEIAEQASSTASNTPDAQIPRVHQRNLYLLAEEFAFRKLEREFQTKIQRAVVVNGIDIDGLMPLSSQQKTFALEVKLVTSGYKRVFDAGIASLQKVRSRVPQFELMLILLLSPRTSSSERLALEQLLVSNRNRINGIHVRVFEYDESGERLGFLDVHEPKVTKATSA
jgi:hypothetical protein